jgi:hypothetical protein
MTETTWIVLIIAATVLIVLFIFRRQLKDFILKVNSGGLDAHLSTHSPQPDQGSSTPAAPRGVKISGNKMFGWLQRIFVRHDQAEVSDNVMAGGKQDIVAVADSPLVAHLHQQFTLNFSVNDFRALCIDLGQDYAALPGAGLEDKAHALLAEFEKQQRIPQLVDAGRRIHPELPWRST